MADIANAVSQQATTTQTTPTETGSLVKYKALDGSDITLSISKIEKSFLSPGVKLKNSEYIKFMAICKSRKLNPYAGDCRLQPFDGSAHVVVSKEYHIRTAKYHPTYEGFEAGVIVATESGDIEYRDGEFYLPTDTLIGGWCHVHDSSQKIPIKAAVNLNEYNTGKSIWRTKPATMIRKVAIVHAMREAYPDTYQGIYSVEEMPPADNEPREVEIIEEQS